VTDATTVHAGDQPANERPLDDTVWDTLVDSVIAGECTPFLGAGVAQPYLPTGGELSGDLADEFGYPLKDKGNLPRVTQYIATRYDPRYARRRVRERIEAGRDQFIETSGEQFPGNYRILASLKLPLYLTTNYDDFLTRALKAAQSDPREVICRWNGQLFDDNPDGYQKDDPTKDQPVVFHMHGHLSKDASLLVTEDDYIDFTVSLTRPPVDAVIPYWVRQALSYTTLLFVGYSLEDWNFRVLMRQLMKQQNVIRQQQALSLSIQLSDDDMAPEQRDKAERFLADYLGTSAIRIYWGEATPFLEALGQRYRGALAAGRRRG
jgi:hypothetical protein